MDFALNKLQWLICNKPKYNQTEPIPIKFKTIICTQIYGSKHSYYGQPNTCHRK